MDVVVARDTILPGEKRVARHRAKAHALEHVGEKEVLLEAPPAAAARHELLLQRGEVERYGLAQQRR